MTPSQVLFVHTNFPGQFGFLASALKQRGARVVAIGSETAKSSEVQVRRWALKRGTTPGIFPLAVRAEADLLRGRAAVDCAVALKQTGFEPEVIIGHPGWGETLFMREVWPDAKQILHGEFYYRATGADVGFDPEFGGPLPLDERCRVHGKNGMLSAAYIEADAIVSPTAFQASLFPKSLAPRMRVIHEGVDTKRVKFNPNARVRLASGRILDRTKPVVTFINRRFEPLRGFHTFMRALPKLLQSVPEAEVILIGADDPKGYGAGATGEISWKAKMLAELGDRLDLDRLHFVGTVPHNQMITALSISAAHVYYTYPFVLSWSLLEAMAAECLVIGSDTAPLRDAIKSGENGMLLDFFDVDALSNALITVCRRPESFNPLRRAARQTVVDRFDRDSICLPAWMDTIQEVLGAGLAGQDTRAGAAVRG